MNNQNLEEFNDELCLNLYLELYKKNKPKINKLNWSVALGSISASFAMSSFIASNEIMTRACWGLCAAAGIFTLFVIYKKHKIFNEIEREVLKYALQTAEAQKKINAFIGPMASMFGLSIDYAGTIDEEKIMEMIKDNSRPEDIGETNFQVIDDSEEQLALSQERAFALKEYINDVAYEGYEEDLVTAEMLIMELVRCPDNDAAVNFNYEVDKLAQKAYFRALGLYSSMGR